VKKIGVLPAAIAAAALFGMIHNQISYFVSPEYYTKFKSIQFRLLDPHVPDRVRVAIVGFRASWCDGNSIGHPLRLGGIRPEVTHADVPGL
jgi:hypothetical protein